MAALALPSRRAALGTFQTMPSAGLRLSATGSRSLHRVSKGRRSPPYVAVALVILAGCVGASAAALAVEPTREAYIAKVDPLCQETDRKVRRAISGYPDALDADRHARAARILARALRIYDKSLRRLASIEPPAQDASRIDKWLGLEKKDVAVTKRMVRALRQERISRFNRLVDRSRALERRIDATIGNYGFRRCN